jgi:hypothetical protein
VFFQPCSEREVWIRRVCGCIHFFCFRCLVFYLRISFVSSVATRVSVSHRPQPVKQQRKSAATTQTNNAALAFKELHRTVKKARAFEIRKLVRRIKQLRGQSAGKGDDDLSGDDDATNSTIGEAESGAPDSEETLKIIADLALVKAMDVDVLTSTAARKLAADAFQIQLCSMSPSPYLPSGSTPATAGEREKMLALRIVHSKQVTTVCEAAKKKHENTANTAVVAAAPTTAANVESAVKESVEKCEESTEQNSAPAKKLSLLDKLRAALAAPAPDQSDDGGSQSDIERMQWSSDDDSDDFPIAFGNRDSDGDDDERVAEAAAAAAGQFGDAEAAELQSDSESEPVEADEPSTAVEAAEPTEPLKAEDKRPAKKVPRRFIQCF